MKKFLVIFTISAFFLAGAGILVSAQEDNEIEDCIQELVKAKKDGGNTSFWDKIMKFFGQDRTPTYASYRAFCETKRDFPDFNTDWQKNYNYLIEQKYEFPDFNFVPKTEKSDEGFKTYGVQKLSGIHYEKYEDILKKSIEKIQNTNKELDKILSSKDYVCINQKASITCPK